MIRWHPEGPVRAENTDGYILRGFTEGGTVLDAWALMPVPSPQRDGALWLAVAHLEGQPINAGVMFAGWGDAMEWAKAACEAWATKYGRASTSDGKGGE